MQNIQDLQDPSKFSCGGSAVRNNGLIFYMQPCLLKCIKPKRWINHVLV